MAKMPTEVLGEIFHLLRSGTVVIPSDQFKTLWSATQTCSKWRNAALGLHKLWSDLSITFQGEDFSDKSIVYFTKQCLLRSNRAPLFLQITEDTPYALGDISFLIPHSSRIQRLSITARSKIIIMAFPHLEFLCIQPLPYPCAFMHLTPALTELKIDDELPLDAIEGISDGSFWPSLRLIECNISAWFMDKFLDMLESRAGETQTASPRQITDVAVRCLLFKVTEEQWERVRLLQDRGLRIYIEESVVDQGWFVDIPQGYEDIDNMNCDEDDY